MTGKGRDHGYGMAMLGRRNRGDMVAVFTDSKQPFFLSPQIPETQANGAHYSRWLFRFLKVEVAARRTGKPMMKIRHGNAMKRHR